MILFLFCYFHVTQLIPGHGSTSHVSVSMPSPTHIPLYKGAGSSHVLVRDLDDEPHVALQSLKSPQADQFPFSGSIEAKDGSNVI